MKIRKMFVVFLAVLFSLSLVGCKENELQKQLDGLTATVGQLNGTINELNEKIDQLNGEIDDLKEEKDKLSKRVRDLEWENFAPYGYMYSLEEVYNLKLLTKDDLLSMAYHLNRSRKKNEELMAEDYQPQPLQELGPIAERRIKETIAFEVRTQNSRSVRWDDVWFSRYLGWYKKDSLQIAVFIYNYPWGNGGPDAFVEQVIDGITFIRPDYDPISVWVGTYYEENQA